jgi:hypothetical protein
MILTTRFLPVAAICSGFLAFLGGVAAAQEINPYPREVIDTSKLVEWTFETGATGWTAGHDCAVSADGGDLRIQSSGDDPYLFGPAINIDGPVVARIRMRCKAGGNGQFFWTTSDAPDFQEAHSQHFQLQHDNQWHDYGVALAAEGTIRQLRLDPAEAPGAIEVESIQLVRETLHPLEIQSVHAVGAAVTVRVKNYGTQPIPFTLDGQPFTIGSGATEEYSETVPGKGPFRTHDVVIQPSVILSYDSMAKRPATPLPPIHRLISIFDPASTASWAILKSGDLVVRAARDGSGARIELAGHIVGVLAPLMSPDHTAAAAAAATAAAAPKLTLTDEANTLSWRGKGVSLALSLRGDEITETVHSDRPCEGPVLRAFGPLEQGLFPGLEYLARGEHSSSTLDIETEEHIRFAPDPMKVTMPLMAFVTDRAMTAMTWRDMSLQPVFATPNFLDGCEGHRAALRGTNFECTILVRRPGPMEDAILWAAQRQGLPPLPVAPRSRQEELALCESTLSGPPLKTAEGWGHCAEASWARQPYADQASTLWRLTGQIPSLPRLVPGGAHFPNDSIYFVTGRASEWLQMRSAQARSIIAEQKPDGSFRYEGELRRGHFEDTASGYCAARAIQLLDFARLTGDTASLQAGIKSLDFMKHFRDPRGAQTWECPLHTPDILASAYLVHAFVRGYELTGNTHYLDSARAWAITGLPFVYQWSNEPTMAYATIAVFGATHWRAPNWMGMPVQWCGYVYADALAMLAPLDHTMDWKRIATGILTTAEQMQYPSGEFAGCEPDSFQLASQKRNGPAINPCALVSLRFALEGKVDSLAVATGEGHRITAPFPVTIHDGHARISATDGIKYQVVVDGARIINVTSQGNDIIALAATP